MDNASAGSFTTFTTNGGLPGSGGGGEISFFQSSTADHALFVNNGSTIANGGGGHIDFLGNSTAANGTFVCNPGTVSSALAGSIHFDDFSSAGNGIFTNNGTTATAVGGRGFTEFFSYATGGNATIINNGSVVSNGVGGATLFTGGTNASNARLIANSGSNGGRGGEIRLSGDGGTCQVKVFGNGYLDTSYHDSSALTIGSLEGSGNVFLGDLNLTVGSNNRSTVFSGVLRDGQSDGSGATGGSLIKIGSGTLTLSGTNLYTGGTRVDAGRLMANNAGGSATGTNFVMVNNNGSALGGTGTISGGPVTVNPHAALSGGDAMTATGSLKVANNVTFNPNSMIELGLGGAGAHSTLSRTGGTWSFANNQAFAFINAGAQLGIYDNIITGLAGDPGSTASWTITTPGFVGTFTYDGAGNVDLTITGVPTGSPTPVPTPTPSVTPTPGPTATPMSGPINPNNILVSIGTVIAGSGAPLNLVREFTPAGVLVQNIPFNYNNGGYSGSEYLKDIAVDHDGSIAAYNGTFAPFLTRYSSIFGTFTHVTFAGWSTSSDGGIAAYQDFVFVTDSNTAGGGSANGIVRFDIPGNTAIRFATGTDFRDLNMGLDGKLYALSSATGPIKVYDPVTMALLRQVPLPTLITSNGGIRSVAADQIGHLFVCGTHETVYRLDSSGTLEASKITGFASLSDIDIDETGRLIVGQNDGHVLLGDTTLIDDFSSFVAISSPSAFTWTIFVSFGRPIAAPSPGPTATPTPTATSTPTSTPSPTPISTPTPVATPTPTPGATPSTILGNISTRLRVETDDNVLIGGFIVSGTQPKRVIVRAIGPSLPVTGALANPILELRDSSGGLIRANDNWRSDQESEIIATTIPPSDDLESAIVETLPANGSAYTAIVRGVDNGTGVGLIEAYDLDPTVNSKLANISTRGLVQTGNDVMIAGTIVLGQASQRVLVRALGPSLPVSGNLADPMLELRDGNGTLIRANDNWRSDQESEIVATTIPPSNDLESAIVATLPANGAAYTAIVSGTGESTGVAIVEVYALN
jgi:autotransporter-associated beta strand protein